MVFIARCEFTRPSDPLKNLQMDQKEAILRMSLNKSTDTSCRHWLGWLQNKNYYCTSYWWYRSIESIQSIKNDLDKTWFWDCGILYGCVFSGLSTFISFQLLGIVLDLVWYIIVRGWFTLLWCHTVGLERWQWSNRAELFHHDPGEFALQIFKGN